MRGLLVRYGVAMAAVVLIAFLVPLGLLSRSLAADRAIASARQDAQSVAVFAGDPGRDDARLAAAVLHVNDGDRRTTVFRPDGTVVGDPARGLPRGRARQSRARTHRPDGRWCRGAAPRRRYRRGRGGTNLRSRRDAQGGRAALVGRPRGRRRRTARRRGGRRGPRGGTALPVGAGPGRRRRPARRRRPRGACRPLGPGGGGVGRRRAQRPRGSGCRPARRGARGGC